MSLLAEVAALAGPTRTRCSVGQAATALDETDRADLVALLADLQVPGSLISKALLARGHNVKPQAVQRHRRGHCACEWPGAA